MKMFANLPSRSLTALVALFLMPAFPDDAPADVPYKVYAQRLLNALPSGSAVRPDLEKYLEALVNRERRRRGRRALRSSDSVRMAARGQAAEMIDLVARSNGQNGRGKSELHDFHFVLFPSHRRNTAD